MSNLNEYICTIPFNSLELHNNTYFLCCPSWLNKSISKKDYQLNEVWNSDPVVDIRESILDGTFKYCDKKMCPHLSKVIKYNIPAGPIVKKESTHKYKSIIEVNAPENIVMNFDRTCNYKCPSCRIDLIVENSKGIERIQKTIDEIDEYYSHNLKTIYITGTGDPFVSVGFRNYLRNFNPKKYPKLEKIHLHTNASMWNKEMWDSMPNIHKYVKTCEISIDAATKETYETKTRIGGNWENLISNLEFISTIPKLNRIKTSFVVQDTNYHEMKLFHEIMYNIFGNKVSIFFGKITNWGTFTDKEFITKKIWDTDHPLHKDFLNEFNYVYKLHKVYHNMYEFIDKNNKKSLI